MIRFLKIWYPYFEKHAPFQFSWLLCSNPSHLQVSIEMVQCLSPAAVLKQPGIGTSWAMKNIQQSAIHSTIPSIIFHPIVVDRCWVVGWSFGIANGSWQPSLFWDSTRSAGSFNSWEYIPRVVPSLSFASVRYDWLLLAINVAIEPSTNHTHHLTITQQSVVHLVHYSS